MDDYSMQTRELKAGNPYRRGRLSTVDLLIEIDCFVKNIVSE